MISTAHALNLVIILFTICFVFLVLNTIENGQLKKSIQQLESSRNRWRQLAIKDNPLLNIKEVNSDE